MASMDAVRDIVDYSRNEDDRQGSADYPIADLSFSFDRLTVQIPTTMTHSQPISWTGRRVQIRYGSRMASWIAPPIRPNPSTVSLHVRLTGILLHHWLRLVASSPWICDVARGAVRPPSLVRLDRARGFLLDGWEGTAWPGSVTLSFIG